MVHFEHYDWNICTSAYTKTHTRAKHNPFHTDFLRSVDPSIIIIPGASGRHHLAEAGCVDGRDAVLEAADGVVLVDDTARDADAVAQPVVVPQPVQRDRRAVAAQARLGAAGLRWRLADALR